MPLKNMILVIHFIGNDAANPASWMWCIAISSWNQVDMAMEYGLPGRCADINSYIESGDQRIFF